MIPIGTKCIRVSKYKPWEECVVVGHLDPRVPVTNTTTGNLVFGCDHSVEYADGRRTGQSEHELIPIGHDPDAETRKTGREVKA